MISFHLKISSMREEEKGLKQRLCDMEKSKKQLQADLASRDRTIQQLKVMCSMITLKKMGCYVSSICHYYVELRLLEL